MKTTQKRVHIIYSGAVHGVGFRFTAEEIANSLGLKGSAQNCPDGTVEVIVEGEESDIASFMDRIKKAMGSYIRSSKVERQEATGEFDSFGIKFYYE
ncbi:MAG: acylphosphatase [Candidatus Omnitrophota bacterium]